MPERSGLLLLAALALSACASEFDRAGSAAAPHAIDGPPQRIVSLNLCTDQLLMQMVDHDRIRAVTFLASDPQSSAMVEQARGIPATTGAAEQVIAMRPDLVLAGTFSTRDTVAILRRLGYKVVEFEPETDFEAIKANIRKMAEASHETGRGAEMIARIDAALANVPPPPEERPVYADYNANGFTSGDGALVTNIANLAGFETLAQKLGFSGTRQLSLEQMLVSRPDVIDLGDENGGPALATENFRHPALVRLMRGQQVINVPGKYTTCGTMLTLRALDAFIAARRKVG